MINTALKEPVTPKGHFFTGSISGIMSDPLNFYTKMQKEHGDYIKYQLFPKMYMYGLYHPDAVQHVLQKSNYRKPDFFYGATRIFFGMGLFTNEGDSWLKQRRLAQPAFNKKRLEDLSRSMVESIQSTIKEWENYPDGQEINFSEKMMKLTLKVLSTSLFSMDISDSANQFGKALRGGFEYVNYKMNHPLTVPLWVPTSTNKNFFEDRSIIHKVVDEIITARRKEKKDYGDLLDMLINARDDDSGEIMNDQQLRDEVITILVAGHDTTSAALSWTFYLLSQNPEQKKYLLDEVDSVLSGRIPGFADLEKLNYTKMVFEESMRLYPPAHGLPRESTEDDEINGYLIRKKIPIALSQHVTHRHPEFWEKPNDFYPEHFARENVEKRHKFAYFPFGGGSRMCIGLHYAMVEAQLIIDSLLQRFDFELAKDQIVVPDPTFTLMPKNGIRMHLKRK
jgi:cytochrome P450